MKTKEIHDDMDKTLGEDSPCISTVKKWVSDLKRGEGAGKAPMMTHGQVAQNQLTLVPR